MLQSNGDVKGVSMSEKEIEDLLNKNGLGIEKKQE